MPKRKPKNNDESKKEEINLTENERLPLQQQITDFLNGCEDEIQLPGLSKTFRKFVHRYALKLGLKSVSTGKGDNRILHIRRYSRRDKALGEIAKLELRPFTRQLLTNMEDNIKEQLKNLDEEILDTTQNIARMRGEAILTTLGPRVVPPKSNRINNDLYREKQDLPIFQYQTEINNFLKNHSIFIINGETGSGKTTQVPQYILSDSYRRNRPCRIVVSQPRRVAAVSVAHRVAEERGEQVGETVGYQIRMENRVKKTTNLIYTTSGCLLRSIMADPSEPFRKVSHLIIDEIHERDKYTDFTLITVKEQLKRNKNLKVILMSATMDIASLSRYFDDCPVLNVPGQAYDVRIYHLEDILYHTGYRTALMEKYFNAIQPQQIVNSITEMNTPTNGVGVQLQDEYFQETLDILIERCGDMLKSEQELNDYFDQLQYYVESEGMPVDVTHSKTGVTPLMAACRSNCLKFVQFFIQRQANTQLRDGQGFTAMDYAMTHTDGACMQLLQSSNQYCNVSQQFLVTQEEAEKQRCLLAYQKQFNDDSEVDHDLILSLLEGLYRSSHPGAIMVFLPGYNDIVAQRDLINSTLPPRTYRICILHGQMDSQDQIEALKPQTVRKIILSTNIGQTSITIPDLAYIIDSGKVKQKTYDAITESSQLQSVWISQADANQRSGRAGRTQNGVCYRLYSTAKYNFMSKFCVPEFMRIALTEICLYAKALDENCNVQTYLSRALNPPSSMSIQNAIRKLKILEVFNDDETITQLGRRLVEIPLDVQLGKCLLYGLFLKCFEPILTIVTFHSLKDPFILPSDRSAQGQASFQRKSFAGQSFSDQMGILSLYKSYMSVRKNRNRVRDFCNRNYLSQSAMEQFVATRRQIAGILAFKYNLHENVNAHQEDWSVVRLCLVAGFYPNVAVIDRIKNVLVSGAEKQLILQRTSALNPPGMKNLKDFIFQLPHDWVVFYEKSSLGRMCSINMNTIVSPLLIALQCGRDCTLDEEELISESSDATDDEQDSEEVNIAEITKNLNDLTTETEPTVATDKRIGLMTIDNWIKFELSINDAKLLMLLRNLLQTEFKIFLQQKKKPKYLAITPSCVQMVLKTLEDKQLATPIA